MSDWKEGVEHTTAEALIAKDKHEAFLLKIHEAKAVIPSDAVMDDLMQKLESRVLDSIEFLKQQFAELSVGENIG